MASNYWGIPRTTHDIDFVVQFPESQAPMVVDAFKGDFYIEEAAVRGGFRPPYQFNAIDTRSALKVDFWISRPEPFERHVLAQRMSIELFGEPAWIARAEDVILHKLVWNCISPSDRLLTDAAGIVAIQGEILDKERFCKPDRAALRQNITQTDLISQVSG
jgi:hypothetical protein